MERHVNTVQTSSFWPVYVFDGHSLLYVEYVEGTRKQIEDYCYEHSHSGYTYLI